MIHGLARQSSRKLVRMREIVRELIPENQVISIRCRQTDQSKNVVHYAGYAITSAFTLSPKEWTMNSRRTSAARVPWFRCMVICLKA